MGFCIACREFGAACGPLFRVPKDEKTRTEWINALNMNVKYYLSTTTECRVCYRHFRDQDYVLTGTRLRLKPGMQLLHNA